MIDTSRTADLQGCKVNLHVDKKFRPFKGPHPSIPYHFKYRAEKCIQEKIDQDVIEEYPSGEPALWVSNCVLAPKEDGSISFTLDARHVNKAIYRPISRHEDVKSKVAGKKVFSKIDLNSLFGN